MWHIIGFIPGIGHIVSQYCCFKKSDMEVVAKDMEKKGMLSSWTLIKKRKKMSS